MSLITKLICFFMVWIFISFGFLLIGFLLGIAPTTALAVCYIFWWFFVLLACVFIVCAAVSVWLNPDDSRTVTESNEADGAGSGHVEGTAEEHIHWDNPDAPICPEFIPGKCENGSQCTGHHCILPYHWQYLDCNDHEWKNLNEEDNQRLEKMYCDVTLEGCLKKGIYKSFQSNELRRLSTESYVNSSNPLATKWIWYWQHERGFWRMYDKDDTGKDLQESLEKAFWNKQKDFRFRIRNHDYILTFDSSNSMSQRNIYYGTRKTVRRRPGKFVSKDDISQLKRSQKAFPAHNQQEGNTRGTDKPSNWSQMPSTRSYQGVRLSPMEQGNTRGTDKPSHWSHMPSTTPYQRVRLSPITDEFKEIEKLFKNSFMWSVEILAIERVQNPYEWEKYQRKKENMAFVNEMRLFHGTNPEVVEAICKQNFDWRVNGKNGTAYGQGSYFAVNPSKSHCYAKEDNRRSKFMFVAKVLAGSYTEGKSSYQRPPSKIDPGNPASDLYDSCVDKMSDPSIFVIFQNDQLYPEYIIEYSTAPLADMVIATKALIDGVSLLFGRRN